MTRWPAPAGGAPQFAALRSDLLQSRYTVDHLAELLGWAASSALGQGQRRLAEQVTGSSRDPGAVLLRLFVLGLTLDREAVDRALPRTGVEQARVLGLIRADGEAGWVGTCDLRPYADQQHDWWVVSDLGTMATSAPLGSHHVVGIGGASSTLASWTPRPWAARALDLGTGSGVQALHLAGHSAYRVVTDLSPRAVEFARFTCALNAVEVDARQGSLWDPVAGETFDLIICNPPFVITPRSARLDRLDYRDGGAVGDGLVAGVVSKVAEHLRPGGIAQLLGNWEVAAGQDWRERVQTWLPPGLDAWVIQRDQQEVSDYALTWARDAGHPLGSRELDRWYAAWLDDFASRAVERVGFGVITLQRPSEDRAPWTLLEEVLSPVATPMGPSMLAGLRARSWLAMHDDEQLLEVPWTVAPDVTEERIGRPGASDPMVIQLRQGGGLRRVAALDSLSAGMVGALDGELTAAQIVQALAALTQTPVDEVRGTVVPVLRTLIADGLLR